jgi:hypothetical protein
MALRSRLAIACCFHGGHDGQHATAVRKLLVVLDIGLVRDWTRILTERLLILARECQDPICCHPEIIRFEPLPRMP